MKGRALMVSWLFPPHTSIGAKRAYRFARWLPSCGWVPTVLCRRATPASSHDPSPVELPPEVTVRAEYDAAVFSMLTGRGARAPAASAEPPSSLRPSLRKRLDERWNLLVDAVVPTETAVIHAPHASRVIDRLTPEHDLLWTTSYPYHSHWLGVRAAKKHRKPLVVDLRDPWTPNWVHRRKLPHARAVEAWMEREVFDAADAIVVTTWALEALYRERFPQHARKFVTIHNSFDESPDVTSRGRAPDDPLRVIHFGNVYGPWSLATLFRATARLRREASLSRRSITIENYGKLSDRDRALAISLGVEDIVRVHPPLPYALGVQRLREADLLALAAWDDPDAGLYVQGKLFDYLAAGRPVVAESAHDDVTRIVRECDAGVVLPPGDLDAMTHVLRRALDGDVTLRGATRESSAFYSAREATRRLAALFDRVVPR